PDGAEEEQDDRDRGAEAQRAALVLDRVRMPGEDRDQDGRQHEQQRRRGEAERRARRAHLDELARDEAAHGPTSGGASVVSARNASSSEVARGASSCSGTPAANAISPTCAASPPSTTSAPAGASTAVRPARSIGVRSTTRRG